MSASRPFLGIEQPLIGRSRASPGAVAVHGFTQVLLAPGVEQGVGRPGVETEDRIRLGSREDREVGDCAQVQQGQQPPETPEVDGEEGEEDGGDGR